MTPHECIALLNAAEERLPVTTWQVDGVPAWPMTRFLTWWYFNDDYHQQRTSVHADSTRRRRIAQVPQLTRAVVDAGRAWWVDRSHHARILSADAVLLGDNVSRILVESRWYDRFCDPVADALEESGMRSLHLEPYHRYPTPRARPSRRIQFALDWAWLKSRASARRANGDDVLPGHGAYLALLRDHGLDPAPLTAATLIRQTRLIRLAADYIGRILDRSAPSVGFVVDFGVPSMAFNVACRERGIPSIEIQHGTQTVHWAYSRWANVPAGGYAVLPSLYWVWDDEDAERISAWSEACRPWHQPVIGGNAWLSIWLDGSAELIKRYDLLVDQQLPRHADGPVILVTLQTGFSVAQLPLLRDAAQAAPGEWTWWFRLHPTMAEEERRSITQLLASEGFDAGHVASATSLPLYALLRAADVHVTHNSSAVREAESFGLTTVATSADAPAMYAEQVEGGTLIHAEDAAGVVAAVAAGLRRPRPPCDPAEPPRDTVQRMLQAAEGLRMRGYPPP